MIKSRNPTEQMAMYFRDSERKKKEVHGFLKGFLNTHSFQISRSPSSHRCEHLRGSEIDQQNCHQEIDLSPISDPHDSRRE